MPTRRQTIAALAASASGLLGSQSFAMGEDIAMPGPTEPKTFVLVHGAWHGGWCWRLVAEQLRAAGHRVAVPTLTGLGERYHLARPDTDMNTHIEDVLQVLKYEELEDVILVAHSYAGAVAAGVADQANKVLRHIIMLDATILDEGKSQSSEAPPDMIAKVKASLIDGFMLPSWPTEAFAVLPEDGWVYDWVSRRLTSMPWKCLTTPLTLKNGGLEKTKVTYIDCNGRPFSEGKKVGLQKAIANGWPILSLDTGHDAMVTAPDALTAMLLDTA
ncbi:MAG: alpha/beta fold hydrolase [Pseudomonadota bacterium]